jgi:DNA-binding NarL/FixJ family response regulator
MKEIRILIADDHDRIREGLRWVLSKQRNWTVCGEAVDGRDALEKAISLKPDVVILDVRMPNLGGLEAAPLIKNELPHSKILILSQHEAAEVLPLALQAGACGFVSKGDLLRDLVSALQAIIQQEDHSFARDAPQEGYGRVQAV